MGIKLGFKLGRGMVHADSIESQPEDSVTRCGRSATSVTAVTSPVTCKSCLKLTAKDAEYVLTEVTPAPVADATRVPATVHGIASRPMDAMRWVPMGPEYQAYQGTEVACRQIEILARDIPENAFCVYEIETGRVVAEITYGAMEFDTGEFLIMDAPEAPAESFKVQTFRDGEWNTLGTYGPWTHHDAAERFAEESYRENGAPYRVVNTVTGEVGTTFGVPPLMSTPAPVLVSMIVEPSTMVTGSAGYGRTVDLRDAAAGRADGPVRWRAPRGKRKIHTVRRYRRG